MNNNSDDWPKKASQLYLALYGAAHTDKEPTLMEIACVVAGAMAEISLSCDAPDLTLFGMSARIGGKLNAQPALGSMPPGILPSAHQIDALTEKGRHAARLFWEDVCLCEHGMDDIMSDIACGLVFEWEDRATINRQRSLRIIHEIAVRTLSFEFAAQELCDAIIERRLITGLWSAGECITALAAAAGRRQALDLGGAYVCSGSDVKNPVISYGLPMTGALDELANVMTREAVRGGVEAGSDWRFGLAANDMPLCAPTDLIRGIEPLCQGFFRAISLQSWREQAVACAKAAGRMLAVSAGGNLPDIEPAIAKPLAMAALAETYRYVSYSRASMSG